MNTRIRAEVRRAVSYASAMWPNDGRDTTPAEDLRSAFRFLRNRLLAGSSLDQACGALTTDALRYEDM